MMRVFLSWSGKRSQAVAQILYEWLPNVINALQPWMSASDIDIGKRWSTEIAKELDKARIGILCITPENLHAPWLVFEAGALSKIVDKAYVCPLLFDLQPSALKGPLGQFQAVESNKAGVSKLLYTLNKCRLY